MSKFQVQSGERQLTLAAFLKVKLDLSWSRAKALIETDTVYLNGAICRQIDRRLRTGETIEIRERTSQKVPAQKSPPPKSKPTKAPYKGILPKVIYLDNDLVIVDKPAGLTSMRHREEALEFGAGKQRYLPETLEDILPAILGEPNRKLIAVHRIDRDTSGLIVFARNRSAADSLDEAFRAHRIERKYLALTRGTPPEGRIESWFVRDRGDGRRGSGNKDTEGASVAISHFHIVRRFGLYSLVECKLETGRTHQVRIHLGEAGAPLCGESIYDRPLHGSPKPDASGAKRQMLHAAVLGLIHPISGQQMRWESDLPEDMRRMLARFENEANV